VCVTELEAQCKALPDVEVHIEDAATTARALADGKADIDGQRLIVLLDRRGEAHIVTKWVAHPDYDLVAFNSDAAGHIHTPRIPATGERVTAYGPSQKAETALTVDGGVEDPLKLRKGAYLQLDGLVRPGYSGGPILDEDGHIVAMSYAIVPDIGKTYAVPASALAQMNETGS
jgi:hypothetical protein